MGLVAEVAIIMTLFNRERFVEAAVRSVLSQSFADLELIVVDDASTDGSAAIVERLAAADSRVRLCREPKRGVVGALRRGHEIAIGESTGRPKFIGWLDSDDLLVKTAIAETRDRLLADPEAGLVYTDHVTIDEQNRPLAASNRSHRPYSPDALLTELISFQFRLFRSEVYTRCGGISADLTASPDYDFCLRASEVTKFVHLARPLYCYRVHPGSISTARRLEQIENSAKAVRDAIRRRGLEDRYRLKVTLLSRFEIVPRDDLSDGLARI
ncbi:MAG: glycosyltransferase [Planctomycetes bacterium]|nr:glycosyltransferase [Planctomycetota bacterium]